jgi:hypothetical protein
LLVGSKFSSSALGFVLVLVLFELEGGGGTTATPGVGVEPTVLPIVVTLFAIVDPENGNLLPFPPTPLPRNKVPATNTSSPTAGRIIIGK